MRKLMISLCALFISYPAFSAPLQRYQPGFRTIDGTQLNTMVDALNSGLTCATYYTGAALAANTDTVFFVATRAMKVKFISEVHAAAAGGASVLQVTKDTGTAVPGAGTALLSTAFNLNATANTVQVGSLVGTAGVVDLVAGNRLAVDYQQAVQSTAGVAVTACLAPN